MPRSNEELRKWSRDNWNKVPELVRNDCIKELEATIPPHVISLWKTTDYMLGFFHFGAGMQVRNTLRKQLTDEELPGVTYVDGDPRVVKNWDDYYIGAIDEMLERYNDDGTRKETK